MSRAEFTGLGIAAAFFRPIEFDPASFIAGRMTEKVGL